MTLFRKMAHKTSPDHYMHTAVTVTRDDPAHAGISIMYIGFE